MGTKSIYRQNTLPWRDIFLVVASALILILFTYASLSKLIAYQKFIGEMNNQPIPKSWTPFLVRFIPSAELAVGVLLAFDRARILGFLVSAVFMLVFTVYTVVILLHGFDYIPCTCGGMIRALSWPQHLWLNSFFLLLSLAGLLMEIKKRQETRENRRSIQR